MPDYGVSYEKRRLLEEKMARLNVREADIIEQFIRSGGHGGQSVNKTETCVYLKHIPTGLEVKCQKERSQALNRYIARKILVDKIETKILGISEKKKKIAYKIRMQKKRRSKKYKERMLENKHINSERKEQRSKINNYEY